MPLVRIEVFKGARSQQELRKLADTIQVVLERDFAAPPRDRYQIITQHEPGDLICEDTGLGFERTDKLVMIQVFQQGRSAEQKKALYRGLKEDLGKECGLRDEDLWISCSANSKEDWSFGKGRAQFIEGDL